ncbi:MAG: HD domain-containing protein [Minisyncoccales bacterium]
MERIFSFLEKTDQLKEIPKKGWVLMGVKNPETISDHIVSTMISLWILGKEKGISLKTFLSVSLIHDLGEVFAGDQTPFFYWDHLDIKKKEERKILLQGVRLSLKEKKKRAFLKLKKEKDSLLKLLSFLPQFLEKEIFALWIFYNKGKFPFVKQVDRLETLLQSIFYLGVSPRRAGTSWLEGTQEIVQDPFLVEFLNTIKNKFYQTKEKIAKERKKRLEKILNFLTEIREKKEKKRSLNNHIFTLCLLAFLFSHFEKKMEREKLLEMALFSHLPYFLLDEKLEEKYFFSKNEIKDLYSQEKKALFLITRKLPFSLKEKIFRIWQEAFFQKTKRTFLFYQIHLISHFYNLFKKRK